MSVLICIPAKKPETYICDIKTKHERFSQKYVRGECRSEAGVKGSKKPSDAIAKNLNIEQHS